MIHQVCDDLGIRLAFEDIAGFRQLATQLIVILDDAVMHDCHARCCGSAGKVRVRVMGGRRAMGRPSCMRNACETIDGFGLNLFDQFSHALSAAGAL